VPNNTPSLAAGGLFDDRYELVRDLGSGTAGEVWEAVDKRMGRTVALKILAGTDEDAAWHEATRLTDLKSPNILPVHNAGLAVDVPYLDTELAHQGTAKGAAAPRGMELERAVRLTRDVLRGLALCHQRGVLHRDVKPANVFLTATDDARLGDFGQAALMDGAGTAKATGDPDVRPPDVIKGARHDVSADVYAAGLTLYALLTGDLPHSIVAAGGFPQHKANVLAGMPDIRDAAPHVGTSLAKVVRKATAAKPTDRYPTAADLDSALGGLPKAAWAFHPIDPHMGHDRCWSAERLSDGHLVDVCASSSAAGTRVVEVRHTGSGNRLKNLCGTAQSDKAYLRLLRAGFDGLRKL
jgi:serine/threonine protein kinase